MIVKRIATFLAVMFCVFSITACGESSNKSIKDSSAQTMTFASAEAPIWTMYISEWMLRRTRYTSLAQERYTGRIMVITHQSM